MPFIVIVVLIIVALVMMQFFGKRDAATRADGLAGAADDLGFGFSVFDTFDIETMPFALFRFGKGRMVENVMWGTRDGLPVKLFDYEYYAGGHENQPHRFTCAVMTIPAACPWLCVTHEDIANRAGDHVGVHGVQLEYDDFNRHFQVQGDQTFAFTMLDGRMMEWLLEYDVFDRVEVVGPWVLLVRRPLIPAAWTTLVNWLDEFHTHIPPVVYSSYPPQ